MKTYNVYQAKTNFSKLLALVEEGEEVVIAKNGKPLADLTPHKPKKNKIKFGVWANRKDMANIPDKALEGIDPDIQEMFYGKDWDK